MRTDNLKHSTLIDSIYLPHILVVDSDPDFNTELTDYMSLNGFSVETATSIQQALRMGTNRFYDIVIVNTQVVEVSGVQLINSINKEIEVITIAVIDDHNQTNAKIAALEAGANDCLSKPVNCRELLLRIRHQEKLKVAADCSGSGAFVAVIRNQEIYAPNRMKLKLNGNEFQLMMLFIKNRNKILSRDTISAAIYSIPWAYEDRRIDNLVANLRKIVEPANEPPAYIKTVRNQGYIFVGEIDYKEN